MIAQYLDIFIKKITKKFPVLLRIFHRFYDGTYTECIADWKWILSYCKKYVKPIIVYTFFGLFGTGLSLGSAYLNRYLINILVGLERDKFFFLIAVSISSSIFSLLLSTITGRILLSFNLDVSNSIRADIFDKIIDSKWSELSRFKSGDIIQRFSSDINSVSGNVITWIPNIIVSISSFIATFYIMLKMDKALAFIAFASAPIMIFFSRFFMRTARRYTKKTTEMSSNLMAFNTETFNNFDMIKSFGISDIFSKRLRLLQGNVKVLNLNLSTFQIKSNMFTSAVGITVSFLAFYYCLYGLWQGTIKYGDMAFFLSQRGNLTGSLQALGSIIPAMLTSAVSAHRVRELVELEKEDHNPFLLDKIKENIDNGLTLKVEDVTFNYVDNVPVYNNSNFIARSGEIIGIIGPSGGGKTTLLRLLLGLVSPNEGKISLNTSDGEEFQLNAELRTLFSYVPQGNNMMSGTIIKNMRLVKDDATEEEIIDALKKACAWDFIKDLPNGIETELGENVTKVSQGQAQRLSIARALLRDQPILMLDEATSALDFDVERELLSNIIKKDSNKIIIISTHRVSPLSLCDRIYNIKNNTITELTPEEAIQHIQNYSTDQESDNDTTEEFD